MVEKPRWLPFINAIQWRHKNLSALEICFSFKQWRRHENKDIFGLKAFFWNKKDSSSTTFDLNWKFLLRYHSSIHQKSQRKEIILVWNLQKKSAMKSYVATSYLGRQDPLWDISADFRFLQLHTWRYDFSGMYYPKIQLPLKVLSALDLYYAYSGPGNPSKVLSWGLTRRQNNLATRIS